MPHDLDRRSLQCLDLWFSVDSVKDDPATTEWKRTARLRQHQWAVRRGHGGHLGFHPYSGKASGTSRKIVRVGSRLEGAYARASRVNLVNEAAIRAAEERIATAEPHQTLNTDRLWADLLSSMPLCFNLFGELFKDDASARRAVEAWWPDTPSGRVEVRFEHSPGRLDPRFLNNRSAFDVAFEINPAAITGRGIIGVETKYHEHAKVEVRPSDKRLPRYLQVAERSDAFAEGWRDQVIGTNLQQIWLDHLLLLSMLQQNPRVWTRGRFVLVYPAENPSFAAAAKAYVSVLKRPETFEARTIESLLEGVPALSAGTVHLIRERYLQSSG